MLPSEVINQDVVSRKSKWLNLRKTPKVLGLVSLMFLTGCASSYEVPNPLPSDATVTAKDSDVFEINFLAFGDSGYLNSKSKLTRVSRAMRQYCQDTQCDFALMAGDNIYPNGAKAKPEADSKIFGDVFTIPFGDLGEASGDAFRIYSALGNHDWRTSRDGAFAQIKFHETTRPFYMDGPFYSVIPASGKGKVEIFVLDTEMLLAPIRLQDIFITPSGQAKWNGEEERGGSKNALPRTAREQGQLKWLKSALKNSTAEWKIVLAHHPLWESKGSKFAQAATMREMLLPTLCEYADAYIAGHQHTLEVHEDSCETALPGQSVAPLLHIVSGAASKTREVFRPFMKWQSKQYPQLTSFWAEGKSGFAAISVSGDRLEVDILKLRPNGRLETAYTHTFSNRR